MNEGTFHNISEPRGEKTSLAEFETTKKMNTSLKRSYSVSESDDCSEEDLNGGGGNCAVTSGSQSYRSPTRKRRRGVIEKRRRDRINVSLDELKRLVPQALEKSGSAKLEKAEILQMTVDHLKVLHANKVYDMNGSYKTVQPDTHKIATDYHGLGRQTIFYRLNLKCVSNTTNLEGERGGGGQSGPKSQFLCHPPKNILILSLI